MRTSCRFGMAVHVLAVLAYADGDRITSALLARASTTNPVIIRRLLLALQKAGWWRPARAPAPESRLSRSPKRIQHGRDLPLRRGGGSLFTPRPANPARTAPSATASPAPSPASSPPPKKPWNRTFPRPPWQTSYTIAQDCAGRRPFDSLDLTVSFFVRLCNINSYIKKKAEGEYEKYD